MDDLDLEASVRKAQAGDRTALEAVVRAVQNDVFHLALRMVGHPDDARDASQEVLVRIVTKLGSFRGESRFRTWVYRLAARALLNFRSTQLRPEISFDQLAESLDAGLAFAGTAPGQDQERDALVSEVKLVCTQGMLSCLDGPHRLAYILGEILELSGEEAAAIVGVSEVAYRKRLSRARDDLEAFLQARCGLANPDVPCRCARLVPASIASGLVSPGRLSIGRLPTSEVDRLRTDIERARSAAEVFRSLPRYASPADFALVLRHLLERNDSN
jgi:RNA polymerase sigma factor (sigma-70 family)